MQVPFNSEFKINSIGAFPEYFDDQEYIDECIKLDDYTILETAMKVIEDPNKLKAKDGRSLFGRYVMKGNYKVVEIFLKNKANPNGSDWLGTAFLSHAVSRCHQAVTELLLNYGASTDCIAELMPKAAIIYDEILAMAIKIGNVAFITKVLSVPCSQMQLDKAIDVSFEIAHTNSKL